MKAAFITEKGPIDRIQYGELPRPEPGPHQVLVRVVAVSVNPIDTYIRSGMVAMDVPIPYILGCDLAGVVEQVGPEVTRFRPGDRVWGTNQGLLGRQGTFAEYAVVDEQWLYPLPQEVSFETAAAIALVGITAHLGLFHYGQLQPGEWICVSGGSGAIGATVIQMARIAGAHVIATTSSEAKARYCRELGAEHVINYREEPILDRIHQILPDGVQMWWETSREPDLDLAVGASARHGRIIVMAGRDARPAFPVGPFYVKCLTLKGFVMFMTGPEEQQRAAEDINRWLVEGKLRPRIDRILPLSQAAEAHRLQEARTLQKQDVVLGKIVLRPDLRLQEQGG